MFASLGVSRPSSLQALGERRLIRKLPTPEGEQLQIRRIAYPYLPSDVFQEQGFDQ